MNLASARHIYFLGIGGIGMSALARYFCRMGKVVSGYDRSESVVTRGLVSEGVAVYYEMDPAHVQGQDLLVHTPAITVDSVEYQAAQQAGVPILKRSQVLGMISGQYRTLAVAGTHGKTTTSAMLDHLLRHSGIACTSFLGGIARPLGSNFVWGSSDWLVAEADEYDRSFLTLHPELAIINSLDPDHLDIYGSAAAMQESYRSFAGQARHLLVHSSLADVHWPLRPMTFGWDTGEYQASRLRYTDLGSVFDYHWPGGQLRDVEIHMPGRHNVLNLTAALSAALWAGADPGQVQAAAATFEGLYRRFEVLVHGPQLTYIDDYAHHPRELEAAIGTARALFPDRQLVVVFQPHLYSRTRDFCEGFAEALDACDQVLLMDIYPAREAPIPGVRSELILAHMRKAEAGMVSRYDLIPTLRRTLVSPAVLLTLGAGDIDKEVDAIADALRTTITVHPRQGN